jgi:hypothetical protein
MRHSLDHKRLTVCLAHVGLHRRDQQHVTHASKLSKGTPSGKHAALSTPWMQASQAAPHTAQHQQGALQGAQVDHWQPHDAAATQVASPARACRTGHRCRLSLSRQW